MPMSGTIHFLKLCRQWLRGALISTVLIPLIAIRASAAGISVTPIPITLSPAQRSELLQVINGNASEGSFQIKTFGWTQTSGGKMELLPSQNIVAFPALFTIGANQTRNIRIAPLQPPGTKEDTYRIIVQQLPPPPVLGQTSIQVLASFDMPVFVVPTGAQAVPAIATPQFNAGTLTFSVTDAGTAHIRMKQITVTGEDAAGYGRFSITAAPSYVLAGGRRDYKVDIAPHDCTATRMITITAFLSDPEKTITIKLPVPQGTCANSEARKTGFEGETRQTVTFLLNTDSPNE